MNIQLKDISKRFGNQWIFKNVNYTFNSSGKYSITGHNGSGKSTLLRIIIAKIPFTKGKLNFSDDSGSSIPEANVYSKISIATTSMDLIEEFTLEELINFHFKFRKYLFPEVKESIYELLDLENEKRKFISNFSSGMKQRLKLGLSIFSKSEILIFDEPGSNLDEQSKRWFQDSLASHLNNRMLIIASNDAEDYQLCESNLNLKNYK